MRAKKVFVLILTLAAAPFAIANGSMTGGIGGGRMIQEFTASDAHGGRLDSQLNPNELIRLPDDSREILDQFRFIESSLSQKPHRRALSSENKVAYRSDPISGFVKNENPLLASMKRPIDSVKFGLDNPSPSEKIEFLTPSVSIQVIDANDEIISARFHVRDKIGDLYTDPIEMTHQEVEALPEDLLRALEESFYSGKPAEF